VKDRVISRLGGDQVLRSDWVIGELDPAAQLVVPALVQWRCAIQALQSGRAQARGRSRGGGGEVGWVEGKRPYF